MFYYIINNNIVESETVLEDYTSQLSSDQISFYLLHKNATIDEIINCELVITFLAAKKNKLMNLSNLFNIKLQAGYYDEVENVTLALLYDDRKTFTESLAFLWLAYKHSLQPTNYTIADKDGQLHTMLLANYEILIIKYGTYYMTMWQMQGYYKNLINSCTTSAELNTITITF